MSDPDKQSADTPTDDEPTQAEPADDTPFDDAPTSDAPTSDAPTSDAPTDADPEGTPPSTSAPGAHSESTQEGDQSADGHDDNPPETSSSVGRTARVAAIVIGVAFVGLMAFAAVRLIGAGTSGSGSPEEAVQELALALSSEDPLGILGALTPTEVATLPDLYPKLVQLAEQEGLLERTQWLTGIDIDISGLETRTIRLHPDVAVVELLSGELSATVGADADGEFFSGVERRRYATTVQALKQQLDELARDWSDAVPWGVRSPDHLLVMTVKQDGGWYVSPMYTVTETGRQILDLPEADFTISREQAERGADTAADVIGGIVDAVNARSVGDHYDVLSSDENSDALDPLNALVSPREIGALVDYGSSYTALFARLADEGVTADGPTLAEMLEAEDFDIEGQLQLRVDTQEITRPNGSVAMHLESGSAELAGSATINDDTFEFDVDVSWDGFCGEGYVYVRDALDERFGGCATATLDDWYYGIDSIYVIVSEQDGSWYANWLATVLSYIEVFVDHRLEYAE